MDKDLWLKRTTQPDNLSSQDRAGLGSALLVKVFLTPMAVVTLQYLDSTVKEESVLFYLPEGRLNIIITFYNVPRLTEELENANNESLF